MFWFLFLIKIIKGTMQVLDTVVVVVVAAAAAVVAAAAVTRTV